MTQIMDMYLVIAAEYGFQFDENRPVYELMHFAAAAEKRRNDRIKAVSEGKTYVG